MRTVLSLVLLTGLAPVGRGNPEEPRPAAPAVPVLRADAVDPLAVRQLAAAAPTAGHSIPTPVSSLEGGLPHVQSVSERPIVAMAESGGWFFYATSVARDEKTSKPRFLIAGYAVQRDGRQVIAWSVW
jgi:hypothetical protein